MAAIGLAACTQDELTDGTLPEGKYPLVINATGLQTATLDTRATVDGDWHGVNSVAVQVGNEVKEYSVTMSTDAKTATLSNDSDPFYWDATTMTVSAWYPYGETMPEVVVGADQSSKENFDGSDFISAENQTVTFGDNSTPTLVFSHRTARVKVILKGDEITSVDGATVSLIGLTTEYDNPATITPYNSDENTFEALLRPQTISAHEPFIQVVLNGETYSYGLEEGIELEANHCYTYNVTVSKLESMILTSCTISDWEGDDTPVETVSADYADDGQGTYTVYTSKGLKAVADLINAGNLDINVKLDRDIDLTGVDWTPIANNVQTGSDEGYSGTFDGQGHRITGLRIENPSEERFKHIALFKSIGEGGTVKNLQLVNVDFDAGESMCGGIAVYNYGTITACSVTGTLVSSPEGTGSTGGIVYTNNKTITACWFNGNLDGGRDSGGLKKIGGIAVNASKGSISACYWGGNAEKGADDQYMDATVEATKVNDGESWQSAIDGMNAALSGNDYEWALGTDGLPVLKKK